MATTRSQAADDLRLTPLEAAAWLKAVELAKPKPPNPHLNDPVGWVNSQLGEHLWSKQRAIAESVVNNRRTAVRSCHNAGKSWIASRIAAWWIAVHPPGSAFVASTAPSYPQVHAILWEEIRKAARVGAKKDPNPVPGRVLQSDEWKLDDGVLVGWGRKPADNDEHGFQGIHREFVLVILDEACGIPRQLWTAVEAITTGAGCRILAIGNPDDPNTEFGDVCKPGSGWNTIQISAFDTPNFTDEPFPDKLRPLMLDRDWVEDKKRRWGEDSPRYIAKILGSFPDIGIDTLFPPSLIEAAQARALEPSGRRVLGVDVARFGTDRSVIYLRHGGILRLHGEYSKEPTTATTGRAIAAFRETNADEIRVDGVGVGAGVVDQLTEQGFPVLDMQAGAKASESDRFLNCRAEWAWTLRDAMEAGEIDLDPTDDDLAAQLGALKFDYTSKGQIFVESKDSMRKRGLPSPDRADAAILTAMSPQGTDLFRPLHWRLWRHAVGTGIAGQVDTGGRITTRSEGWTYCTAWLPSGEDASTDWAVVGAWCQTIAGDLLLLDLKRARLGDNSPTDLMASLVRTWQADTVFVARRQITDVLRAQAGRAGVGITAVDAGTDTDLYGRALTASARVASGKVWLPASAPWLRAWTAECLSFPHGRQRGCVAALALAAQVETTRWQPPSRQPATVTAAAWDDGPNFMTMDL